MPGPRSFDDEQRVRLQQGKDRLMQTLRSERCIGYKELSADIQQVPLVWERFLKDWLVDMRESGKIKIDGLKGRAKRPNRDCTITFVDG